MVRRRGRRDRVLAFTAGVGPCVVALEACCGAHHLARRLPAQGHTVRLMSPEYVRPYVKAQKNDDRDAEAIAEAATRPTMRFVESKSEAPLDLQALHRVRDRLVAERTALLNQIRALLLERGISVPQGRWRLVRELPALLSDEAVGLSPRIVTLLTDMLNGQRSTAASLPSTRSSRLLPRAMSGLDAWPVFLGSVRSPLRLWWRR